MPPSVLVVGAGPAGATAARTLARAGLTVRLLDRSAFPRPKPCGGAISLRILRRFPYLEGELPRIATHRVSKLHLEGPEGDSTLIESKAPAALLVRRVEFDQLLVSLAVESGAELVTGTDVVQAAEDEAKVTLVTRDGRRFDAPVVIAADGVHSVIARRLGLNRGWPGRSIALDMMEETPRGVLRDVDPSALWVAYGFEPTGRPGCGRRAAEGYAYIFPKRDHVNVGVGYVLDHYRAHIDAAPYELHSAFVDRMKRRGVLEGDSVRRNFTPFMIPVGGPLRAPARGRVLLAGDAGGFVNGFTAEGIYYAMVSGDLAASSVVHTRPRSMSSLAARYRRACEDEIGRELHDSVILQRHLFGDRRRIAAAIAGARRATGVTATVLDFFGTGRVGYRDVRRQVLARAPLLGAQLAWNQVRSFMRT